MTQLPTEFPTDSVTMLLPLLRGTLPGTDAEKRAAATAGWNVFGYGIGLGLPAAAAALKGKGVPKEKPLKAAQVADYLESMAKQQEGGVAMSPAALSAIPWKKILDLLLPMILGWAA